MSERPTSEELSGLMTAIGKEVKINVHHQNTTWDYGEASHDEFDRQYLMIILKIDKTGLIGILSDEYKHLDDKLYHFEPFNHLHNAEISGGDGGSSSNVVSVYLDDKLLYPR